MTQKEVKVFDLYSVTKEDKKYYEELGIPTYCLDEYHNQIVKKDGTVKPKYSSKVLKNIKPLENNITTKVKWELDSTEGETLSMLKNSVKKSKDLYDSCKRKYERYEHLLVGSLPIEDKVFEGERHKCNLSPIGRCIYKEDASGEYECVFCGEPEERK